MKSTRLLPRLVAIAFFTLAVLLVLRFSRSLPLIMLLRAMPEVASAEMLREPGSGCTLIHIRQTHSPDIIGEATEEEKDRMHLVQRELYRISLALKQQLGLTCFYTEGITEEGLPELQELIANARKIRTLVQTVTSGLGVDTKRREPIRPEDRFDESRVMHELAVAGMDVRQTETEKDKTVALSAFYDAVKKDLETKDWKEVDKVITNDPRIFDDRENGVLRILARDYGAPGVTNHYALLHFGGGHDWKDNVRKWNATNAFKFSLITVTPRSYRQ